VFNLPLHSNDGIRPNTSQHIVTRLAEYRNDGTVVPKELGKGISAVTVPVLTQQPIWKFLGNRFVEAHVHGKARAEETELADMFPLRSARSCLRSGVEASQISK
jgi:hypothetical protein